MGTGVVALGWSKCVLEVIAVPRWYSCIYNSLPKKGVSASPCLLPGFEVEQRLGDH
jgi:hypothetical protein